MNTFKKYSKSWLILFTVLFAGVVTVMGTHWSDTAKTPFWWTFWIVASIVCGVGLVAAWIFMKAKDKK